MADITRIWGGAALLVAPGETKDITFRFPVTRVLFDIRTDAVMDADISVVMTGFQTLVGTVSGLVAPTIVQTPLVANMNKVYEFNSPYPVRSVRTVAYSPTGKLFYLDAFDLLGNRDLSNFI